MKNKSIIITALVLGVILSTVLSFYEYRKALNEDISSRLYRIHVVSNSDSDYDRIIKLSVKDNVTEYMEEIFSEKPMSYDIFSLKEIIHKNRHNIIEKAEETVRAFGKNYPVTLFLGKKHYEKRMLGEFTFPEGDYETLNIVIGEGRGKNFWGLIYPKYCFNRESTDIEFKEGLKGTLSAEEYKLISENRNFSIKLKLFEKIKNKI